MCNADGIRRAKTRFMRGARHTRCGHPRPSLASNCSGKVAMRPWEVRESPHCPSAAVIQAFEAEGRDMHRLRAVIEALPEGMRCLFELSIARDWLAARDSIEAWIMRGASMDGLPDPALPVRLSRRFAARWMAEMAFRIAGGIQ